MSYDLTDLNLDDDIDLIELFDSDIPDSPTSDLIIQESKQTANTSTSGSISSLNAKHLSDCGDSNNSRIPTGQNGGNNIARTGLKAGSNFGGHSGNSNENEQVYLLKQKIAQLTNNLNTLQGKLTIQKADFLKKEKAAAEEIQTLKDNNTLFRKKDEQLQKEIQELKEEVGFSKDMEKFQRNDKAAAIKNIRGTALPNPLSNSPSMNITPGKSQVYGQKSAYGFSSTASNIQSKGAASNPNSGSKSKTALNFVDGFVVDGLPMKRKLAATIQSPYSDNVPSKRFESARSSASLISEPETFENEIGESSRDVVVLSQNNKTLANKQEFPETKPLVNSQNTNLEANAALLDAQKRLNEFKSQNEQINKAYQELSRFNSHLQLELDKEKNEKNLLSSKIDNLTKKLKSGPTQDDQMKQIIEFTKKLFNHRVYGVFESSWNLLTQWKLKDFNGESPAISNVLESHIFEKGSSKSDSLKSFIERFFTACTIVIHHLNKEKNHQPIPVILQLIYFTINYYPDCVIFSASLAKSLCRYLEANVQYMRHLPDVDALQSHKYNPFNLKSTSSFRGKTDKPDSTILNNDAFKEISVIYTLDIIGKMAANAQYLTQHSYINIWSSISLNLISKLASPKSPANVVYKMISTLLSSISEKTIGPISLKSSKKSRLQILERFEIGERMRSNTPSGLPLRHASRAMSTAPNDSANFTTQNLDGSWSLPLDSEGAGLDSNFNILEMVAPEQQGHNENGLIVMLSYHLTYTVSSRHTLLFSGLEDIALPYVFTKSQGNAQKRWDFVFHYIYYNDINSVSSNLGPDYYSNLFNLHDHCGGPENYYAHISQINKLNTLYIRKAVIKFFLETASTKSVRLVAGSKTALTAIVKCVCNTLDQVNLSSFNPDAKSVELIGDCVNLLYTLFKFIGSFPYQVDNNLFGDFSFFSSSPLHNKTTFGITVDAEGTRRWKPPSHIISDLSDDGLGLVAALTLIVNSRNGVEGPSTGIGLSSLRPFADDVAASPAGSDSLIVIDDDELSRQTSRKSESHSLGQSNPDHDGDVSMNDDDIQELGAFPHSQGVPSHKKEVHSDNNETGESEGDVGAGEDDILYQFKALCPPMFSNIIVEQADRILEYYYD